MTSRSDLLSRYSILQGLTEEQLEVFADLLSEMKFSEDEPLMVEGDEGFCMYFLTKGSVKISQKLKLLSEEMAQQIRDKTLLTLKAAHYPAFGEMALIGEGVRTATVTCVEDCELLELHRDAFEMLLTKHHDIAVQLLLNISKTLSSRLAKANQDVLKLTTALSIALG
jgi:CRP-like cAMP-binding protein